MAKRMSRAEKTAAAVKSERRSSSKTSARAQRKLINRAVAKELRAHGLPASGEPFEAAKHLVYEQGRGEAGAAEAARKIAAGEYRKCDQCGRFTGEPAHNCAALSTHRKALMTGDLTKDEELEHIREELTLGMDWLRTSGHYQEMLDNISVLHGYSPRNQLLIHLQTKGQHTHVGSETTWKELGRTIKPTAQPIFIWRPRFAGKNTTTNANPTDDINPTDDTDTPTPDKKQDKDKKPTAKKQQVVTGFTVAKIYDYADTEGEEVNFGLWHKDLTEEPPPMLKENLEQAITDLGYEVEFVPRTKLGRAKGHTVPSQKRVAIAEELSPGEQAHTLAHELAHIAAGHCDEADEYSNDHDVRSRAEVEADSIAYVLLRSNGMQSEQLNATCAEYIESWTGNKTTEMKKIAEKVVTTTKKLLDGHDWVNHQEPPVKPTIT